MTHFSTWSRRSLFPSRFGREPSCRFAECLNSANEVRRPLYRRSGLGVLVGLVFEVVVSWRLNQAVLRAGKSRATGRGVQEQRLRIQSAAIPDFFRKKAEGSRTERYRISRLPARRGR